MPVSETLFLKHLGRAAKTAARWKSRKAGERALRYIFSYSRGPVLGAMAGCAIISYGKGKRIDGLRNILVSTQAAQFGILRPGRTL